MIYLNYCNSYFCFNSKINTRYHKCDNWCTHLTKHRKTLIHYKVEYETFESINLGLRRFLQYNKASKFVRSFHVLNPTNSKASRFWRTTLDHFCKINNYTCNHKLQRIEGELWRDLCKEQRKIVRWWEQTTSPKHGKGQCGPMEGWKILVQVLATASIASWKGKMPSIHWPPWIGDPPISHGFVCFCLIVFGRNFLGANFQA